jgi:hypothetical protein
LKEEHLKNSAVKRRISIVSEEALQKIDNNQQDDNAK